MTSNASRYPVNEMFATAQWDGAFAGVPCVLLRLQGCEVACPWCDVKHTWELGREDRVEAEEVDRKDEHPSRAWGWMRVDEIMRRLDGYPHVNHVVITGGEPCRYDLLHLTTEMCTGHPRRTVQIETSGTAEVRCHPAAWVTVSPKFDMPGGLPVLQSALARADEIKHPVGRTLDVMRLSERVVPHANRRAVFWLQPLSQSPAAMRLCVTEATNMGMRVSIQAHKYLGVR